MFLYYPFDISMTFLFSNLVVEVLNTFNISPGKVPFAWRYLTCLDAIEAKHALNIDVEVVKYSYSLKKFSGCRIGFVNKRKDEPMIFNNEIVNNRSWKNQFFFVDKTVNFNGCTCVRY